jgi:hypothetical protein
MGGVERSLKKGLTLGWALLTVNWFKSLVHVPGDTRYDFLRMLQNASLRSPWVMYT